MYSMSEADKKRLVKSLLVFTALQDVAIEEIEILEGTPFYKTNVKNALSSCKKILEKSIEHEYKITLDEEDSELAYLVILRFIEKWTQKVTALPSEQISELDEVLTAYFKGDFKFIEDTNE